MKDQKPGDDILCHVLEFVGLFLLTQFYLHLLVTFLAGTFKALKATWLGDGKDHGWGWYDITDPAPWKIWFILSVKFWHEGVS